MSFHDAFFRAKSPINARRSTLDLKGPGHSWMSMWCLQPSKKTKAKLPLCILSKLCVHYSQQDNCAVCNRLKI